MNALHVDLARELQHDRERMLAARRPAAPRTAGGRTAPRGLAALLAAAQRVVAVAGERLRLAD